MAEKIEKTFTKEDAYKNLERVNGWIESCNTRVAILFGVLGVVIGLTTEVFKVFGFLKGITNGAIEMTGGNITLVVFQMLFMTAYIIAAIFSVYNLVNVLKARDKSSLSKTIETSILHFWSIANTKQEDFLEACNIIDEEQLLKDINTQVWINSDICNTKFKYHKRALRWILITGALAVITLILVNLI